MAAVKVADGVPSGPGSRMRETCTSRCLSLSPSTTSLWGLAGVVVGVLTVVAPGVTALVMTLYIGAWALVTGLLQIVAAVRLRKEITGEWLLILGGVLSVLFGAFVLAQPGAGMMAMLWVLATYAVVFGVLMVLLSFKLKKGIRHSS